MLKYSAGIQQILYMTMITRESVKTVSRNSTKAAFIKWGKSLYALIKRLLYLYT